MESQLEPYNCAQVSSYHIQGRTHTYIHTRSHAHVQLHTRACTKTDAHAHTHTFICTCTNTLHVQLHTCAYKQAHAHTHSDAHVQSHYTYKHTKPQRLLKSIEQGLQGLVTKHKVTQAEGLTRPGVCVCLCVCVSVSVCVCVCVYE